MTSYEEDSVGLATFGDLIGWFGPLLRPGDQKTPTIFHAAYQVVGQSWFWWNSGPGIAELKLSLTLNENMDGVALLRWAVPIRGVYAITYHKDEGGDSKYHHGKISYQVDTEGRCSWRAWTGTTYPTLESLLEDFGLHFVTETVNKHLK